MAHGFSPAVLRRVPEVPVSKAAEERGISLRTADPHVVEAMLRCRGEFMRVAVCGVAPDQPGQNAGRERQTGRRQGNRGSGDALNDVSPLCWPT